MPGLTTPPAAVAEPVPGPLQPEVRHVTLVADGPFIARNGWMCAARWCRTRTITPGQMTVRDVDGDYFHDGCVINTMLTVRDAVTLAHRAHRATA